MEHGSLNNEDGKEELVITEEEKEIVMELVWEDQGVHVEDETLNEGYRGEELMVTEKERGIGKDMGWRNPGALSQPHNRTYSSQWYSSTPKDLSMRCSYFARIVALETQQRLYLFLLRGAELLLHVFPQHSGLPRERFDKYRADCVRLRNQYVDTTDT